MAEHLWKSPRLVYRGVEPNDEEFIFDMQRDAESQLGLFGHAPSPPNRQSVTSFRTQLMDKCLLAAIICLPAALENEATEKEGTRSSPTPIGHILLSPVDPNMAQHRHCDIIALGILPEYRNKGYATEATQWALRWGFQRANLHSIGLSTTSWNQSALHVYEKIGFKVEGRRREHRWLDGKYYDHIEFGILEDEWRARYLHS